MFIQYWLPTLGWVFGGWGNTASPHAPTSHVDFANETAMSTPMTSHPHRVQSVSRTRSDDCWFDSLGTGRLELVCFLACGTSRRTIGYKKAHYMFSWTSDEMTEARWGATPGVAYVANPERSFPSTPASQSSLPDIGNAQHDNLGVVDGVKTIRKSMTFIYASKHMPNSVV